MKHRMQPYFVKKNRKTIEEGEVLETVVDGLRYSYCTGNGKATAVEDEGYQELTELSLPATAIIDGTSYRVTAIGKRAFQNCRSIKSLTIPEGVTFIGARAFKDRHPWQG